jgi:hypothetical protein
MLLMLVLFPLLITLPACWELYEYVSCSCHIESPSNTRLQFYTVQTHCKGMILRTVPGKLDSIALNSQQCTLLVCMVPNTHTPVEDVALLSSTPSI